MLGMQWAYTIFISSFFKTHLKGTLYLVSSILHKKSEMTFFGETETHIFDKMPTFLKFHAIFVNSSPHLVAITSVS